jgi:type II secretory pathway predicted ATPase ExeA
MRPQEALSYFSLTAAPFTKEIPTEALILLPSVQRCLATAHLLAETRGIGVMTGKSGVGKSCIIRRWMADLPTGLFRPIYVCHTSVCIMEFYTHLCAAFGVEPGSRRSTMFRNLQDRIGVLTHSDHVHPILIIDEAHYLANEILAELRLLTNFEVDSVNALTVLLFGSENLRRRFGLSLLEPLANSVTITIPVGNLPQEETFSYIEGRLTAVGAARPLFTKNALALVHQASGGILRTINTIATASLHKAYAVKSDQVEAEHVQAVIQR